MRLFFAAVLFSMGIAAQTFQLGLPTDPCEGGSPYTVAGGALPTLRFSSLPFSCTFDVEAPGAYIVELDFVEPATANPGTAADGRLFNVTLGDAWGIETYGQMSGVDLVTMGAFSPAVIIARSFLAFVGDPRIKVSFATVKRSAVISRVIVTRLNLTPLFGDTLTATALRLHTGR